MQKNTNEIIKRVEYLEGRNNSGQYSDLTIKQKQLYDAAKTLSGDFKRKDLKPLFDKYGDRDSYITDFCYNKVNKEDNENKFLLSPNPGQFKFVGFGWNFDEKIVVTWRVKDLKKTFQVGIYHKGEFFWDFNELKNQIIPNPSEQGSVDLLEVFEDLNEIKKQKKIGITEKERLISARVGQGSFRKDVMSHWKKCAVTGCGMISLLIASHIKPWRHSDNRERLDPYNGLFLLPTLDACFDSGFISFDDSGKIMISNELGEKDMKTLNIHSEMNLTNIKPEHKKYLVYHRENIFEK